MFVVLASIAPLSETTAYFQESPAVVIHTTTVVDLIQGGIVTSESSPPSLPSVSNRVPRFMRIA